MKSLFELLPDSEGLLALEPEELAGVILEVFNSLSPGDQKISRHNFGLSHTVHQYPERYWERLQQALMEAWAWLEREGLLVPAPAENGWYFVSRRGKQITKASDLAAYRRADMLPKRLLHPIIAQKIWATFLRGDYDTAVFQAFKEIEVGVRTAGCFGAHEIGTALMRRAFDINNGPLTDQTVIPAERQALSDFFAGSIGLFKNPHSHRKIQIEAEEAVEMITLASHLLRIVDARKPNHPT